MEVYGVVYLLVDGTNDFEYVGQTTQTVEERFKQHAKDDYYIGRAIRAHGAENFDTAILKECASKEELDLWEKHFIKSRNTKAPNGYNLTDGGEGIVGLERSPEHCAKLSASKKGKPLSLDHCKKIAMALSGVPKSPEHVAKVATANTGKKRTLEQRAKISAGNTGKKRTPEQCANISAAQRGKKRGPRPPEVKAKISAKNTGKKRTPEQCANISAAHKGKKRGPHSPEHCAKISASRQKNSPFKNLVAELTMRQMSYTSLAGLMGLASATISHKMIGRKNFTDDDKKKLAEIFDKPIEYLFSREY